MVSRSLGCQAVWNLLKLHQKAADTQNTHTYLVSMNGLSVGDAMQGAYMTLYPIGCFRSVKLQQCLRYQVTSCRVAGTLCILPHPPLLSFLLHESNTERMHSDSECRPSLEVRDGHLLLNSAFPLLVNGGNQPGKKRGERGRAHWGVKVLLDRRPS